MIVVLTTFLIMAAPPPEELNGVAVKLPPIQPLEIRRENGRILLTPKSGADSNGRP
jgi:hypothetical protein